MIIARPVISPIDQRYFRINYLWLLDTEIINAVSISIVAPESDPDGRFTLSGTIDMDGKAVILKTNPVVGAFGPPEEGTEYRVDIEVGTNEGQVNRDSLVFRIDSGVYPI